VAEPRDPYRVLGVVPSSAQREIRDAYRQRARMAHPDLVGEDSASWMRDLNGAWEILKDPQRRAAYDAASGHAAAGATTDRTKGTGAGPGTAINGHGHSREPWHGAAGPAPGPAYGTTLDSGIYAGWSLAQVARRDRGYLVWLRDRPDGKRYVAEIERVLGAGSSGAEATGPAKGRRKGR
jgi:curved DNA-binding protein CbpA